MAECGEISMMLGAFEDSELEPNEMQEVAFHLARCESCTGVLADYSTIGRDLRSITAVPIAGRFLERGDRARRSSAAAGADQDRTFPAAPVGQCRRGRRVGRRSSGGRHHDDSSDDAVCPAIRQSRDGADDCRAVPDHAAAAPDQMANAAANEPTMADNDSHADISRLESENHSVAVWSEPRRDTTVIWLPDQP